MPLFPGHRYLGPRNPLRNRDLVDEDDGIAKSHNEAYDLYGMPGDGGKRTHNRQSDSADAKRYQPDSSTGDAEMSLQMQLDAPVRPGGAEIRGDDENYAGLVQQILRIPRDYEVVSLP
ncbi:hypothetical protein MRX96_030792 [Rhipicephalus microplus]